MSLRLYQLPAAYAEWESRVEDFGGEITPELEAELIALDDDLHDQADAITQIIRNQDAVADRMFAEARFFREKAEAAAQRADRLRELLLRALEAKGERKLITDRFTIRVCRNGSPSVRCDVPTDQLPDELRRVVIEPDKRAIISAFRDGRTLPEGIEVVQGNHLRIG